MFQKGKTNIYGGIKGEYGRMKDEYLTWNDDDVEETKALRISVGPAVGAEYFLGDHFSIGGEISVKYMNYKIKYTETGRDNEKYTLINTDSGLLLRFYF